jgi:hypothetical protein
MPFAPRGRAANGPAGAFDRVHASQRLHGPLDRIDDPAGDTGLEQLGHRAPGPCQHRRAARERLDHDHAERLGPVDREEQRTSAAEQRGFLRFSDLAEIGDVRLRHQFGDLRFEIRAIRRVDFGGHAQLHAGAPRDLDGAIQPLLRRDTADERDVVAGTRVVRQQPRRQPVIDRATPALMRTRPPLVV